MTRLVNKRNKCQRVLDFETSHYPGPTEKFWENNGDWCKMTYETIPRLKESLRIHSAYYIFDYYNECRALGVA